MKRHYRTVLASFGVSVSLVLVGCMTNAVAPAISRTQEVSVAEANALTGSAPREVVRFGEDPHLFGELRLPKGRGPFPVAMLMHGGCYVGMDSTANMVRLADWLAANGVASWNVDYRDLASNGGWPTTFNDWASGLAALTPLAKRYPLDLSRLSIVGHSAGVTAAVWLASGASTDDVVARNLPQVRGVVALDGPLELSRYVGIDRQICGQPVLAPLMGGTPLQVRARYDMVDPRVNRVHAKDVLVVNAMLPAAPDMTAAIRASGATVSEMSGTQGRHFDMLVPGTADFARIAPAVLRITKGR